MTDIVENKFREGHDFKISHMAGFKMRNCVVKTGLCCLPQAFLQPCIQMYIDADHNSEERIVLLGVNIPIGLGVDTAVIEDMEHYLLQRQEFVLPQARGQCHLRECFCLQ